MALFSRHPLAALAETEPGALEDALAAMSRSLRARIAPAIRQVAASLAREGNEAGAEVLKAVR